MPAHMIEVGDLAQRAQPKEPQMINLTRYLCYAFDIIFGGSHSETIVH